MLAAIGIILAAITDKKVNDSVLIFNKNGAVTEPVSLYVHPLSGSLSLRY
jgi:hypothetical protein